MKYDIEVQHPDEIIRNPTNAGKIVIKGEEKVLIDGIHQAIVPLELYFQVQEILQGLRLKNKPCPEKDRL